MKTINLDTEVLMYECRGAFSYEFSFLEQKENSPNFPIKVKNANNASQLLVYFFFFIVKT